MSLLARVRYEPALNAQAAFISKEIELKKHSPATVSPVQRMRLAEVKSSLPHLKYTGCRCWVLKTAALLPAFFYGAAVSRASHRVTGITAEESPLASLIKVTQGSAAGTLGTAPTSPTRRVSHSTQEFPIYKTIPPFATTLNY